MEIFAAYDWKPFQSCFHPISQFTDLFFPNYFKVI
jgi:hypothetical protein